MIFYMILRYRIYIPRFITKPRGTLHVASATLRHDISNIIEVWTAHPSATTITTEQSGEEQRDILLSIKCAIDMVHRKKRFVNDYHHHFHTHF